MAVASAPVQEGEVLAGKYRVERVLGVGGMGVVVAALHLQLDQRVALKFMLPEVLGQREAMERFPHEARAVARLKSEHVARILDVGKLANGSPYIVMEYLEGTDLAAILRRGVLPVPLIADYLIQALDALAEAHAIGIIHRDLKPENLFLTRRADGSAWVKVLDFGISKSEVAAGTKPLTRTQTIVGSPPYMSPEHLRSSKLADARSDIWSIGVILYELACGKLPFSAEVFAELVLKVAMDPTPPLKSPQPLPDKFVSIVRRCLEKNPSQRFPNAAELAAALARFAPPSAWPLVERIHKLADHQRPTVQVGVISTSSAPTVRASPLRRRVVRSRRWRWLAALSGVIVVAVSIGTGLALRQDNDVGANSPPAQLPLAKPAPSYPPKVIEIETTPPEPPVPGPTRPTMGPPAIASPAPARRRSGKRSSQLERPAEMPAEEKPPPDPLATPE